MIKIHACQRNKQFMKDLEHNDFLVPKTKGLNLSPKELPIWSRDVMAVTQDKKHGEEKI